MSRPVLRVPVRAGVPPVVGLVTGLWLALLLGATLLWPPLTGYDEPMHVGMAGAYAASPTRLYAPGELRESRALAALRSQLPADPATTPYGVPPASALAARGERPTFAELGGIGGRDPAVAGAPNQMVQHPPLGYLPYAAVLRVPGVAGLPWDQQVWLLRLVSVLMALPVPALAWATARRLLTPAHDGSSGGSDGARWRRPSAATALAVAAAIVPLTLPNLVRVCASVSNDVLLVLTTSLVLLGVARVVTGDLRRRTAVLVGVALAAALWTKGLALVLPPVVVAAYAWALRTQVREGAIGRWTALLRRHRAALLVVLGGTVVGGLWWLRNVVVFGTVQVEGYGAAGRLALLGPPDDSGRLGDFLRGWPYLVLVRTWGGVGLPDTPLPSDLVVWGWPVLVVTGLLLGLTVPSHRRGARVGVALVAALPLVLTLLVVAAGSWSTYHRWSGSVSAAQGRYLYPLVAGVAAGAVCGAARLPRWAGRSIPVVLLVGALLTQASTWAMLLTTWFEPGRAASWAALVAGWRVLVTVSPVAPALTTLLVLVLPVAAALAATTAATTTVVAGARARDNGV